ncbi:MAG: guanylate kinase [Clostridia bacterium]|nr:guanylate kinase [Clostridia bacterium]
MKGFPLIISGPSGSGKDTLINELVKKDLGIITSTSYTTRKARKGETNGQDYFFVDEKSFRKAIDNDEMIEYVKYENNYYGTPKCFVDEKIKEGKIVILKIDVVGADRIRKLYNDSVSIFIMPPSLETLKERLVNRNTEKKDEIILRLEIAKKEILKSSDFDYIIVNNEPEEMVDTAVKIINAHKKMNEGK